MAEYGFVYALSNESMPGMYKIGFTTKHPQTRCDELSSKTGCPTPFRIDACFDTDSPQKIEAHIHNLLAQYRVDRSREFFRVSATKLFEVFKEYLNGDETMSMYEVLISDAYHESMKASESRSKAIEDITEN